MNSSKIIISTITVYYNKIHCFITTRSFPSSMFKTPMNSYTDNPKVQLFSKWGQFEPQFLSSVFGLPASMINREISACLLPTDPDNIQPYETISRLQTCTWMWRLTDIIGSLHMTFCTAQIISFINPITLSKIAG